jgi:hypothetical protein
LLVALVTPATDKTNELVNRPDPRIFLRVVGATLQCSSRIRLLFAGLLSVMGAIMDRSLA